MIKKIVILFRYDKINRHDKKTIIKKNSLQIMNAAKIAQHLTLEPRMQREGVAPHHRAAEPARLELARFTTSLLRLYV